MATNRESEFPGAGGALLYAQWWLPEGQPRAVVALVHGVGEHSGRYEPLANHLAERGFAVGGFDHRGHGKSPGARGHINAWSEYREDVGAFLRHVERVVPGRRIFLYGHSMGAVIAVDYVVATPSGVAGLISSGIPLRPTGATKPHLVAIARILSRIRPAFSIPLGLDVSGISRDPAVVQSYRDDPLVHPLVSVRWGTEMLAAIARVRSRAHEVQLPVLVLHGEADPISSIDGSRELFSAVSSADKTLRVYPGTLHEPHNDLDRAVVSEDVERWLADRLDEAATETD